MTQQKTDRPVCRLAVLLHPSFNALATMAFLDPFRAANYLSANRLYEWEFLSLDETDMTASNGLSIGGTMSVHRAGTEYDFAFVSASWTPERHRSKGVSDWLRRCDKNGVVLGGIDTGAFILAYAGLLSGRQATVHYEHIAAMRELFRDIEVLDALYVLDGPRLTCCGGMASADLALEIIRLQHGVDLANASARYIFHDRLRSRSEEQGPRHHEPVGYSVPEKLRQAIVLMESTLERPLSLPAVARKTGLSSRHMERLFRRHTGVSPVKYYLDVRLDRARSMITQTDLSVLEVSVACGFSTPEYFARCYKKRFGIPPTKDRVEGRIPFQFRSFPAQESRPRPQS